MWCLNYRALAMVLAMLFLLFSFWGATRFVVINLSHSMPVGIYWKQLPLAIHRGDQVLVCLPLRLSKSAYQAGIIHKSSLCGHSYQPLLKQVIATPMDTVTQDQHVVNI